MNERLSNKWRLLKTKTSIILLESYKIKIISENIMIQTKKLGFNG